MTHRYIFRALTIELFDDATELWLGLESEEPLNSSEWSEELIPADGMTNEELAVVQRWIRVP